MPRSLAALTAVPLVFFSAAAAADTLVPADDAHVKVDAPSSNHGDAQTLIVRGGSSRHEAFVRFDLDPMPDGAVVARATLRLFVSKVHEPGNLDARAVALGAWNEATLTKLTAPSISGASLGAIALTDASEQRYVLLDVTDIVQDWLDGTVENLGIALLPVGKVRVELDAKESHHTSHAAELEVVLEGPAGPMGPPGADGPPGLQGASGAQGPAGADGADGAGGPAGPIGPAGASVVGLSVAPGDPTCPEGGSKFIADGVETYACNGAAGVAGASVVGMSVGSGDATCPHGGSKFVAQGVETYACSGAPGGVGATGPAGSMGPQGLAGPAGADGAPGLAGPAGVAGPAGSMGPPGSDGAPGPAGPQGVPGPPGAGTLAGVTNRIVKFTSPTAGGDSSLSDDGTTLTTTDQVDVTGGAGTNYLQAPIEVRTTSTPRIAFHWPGVVASQIGMDSGGVIRTYNNPGTNYEQFAASNIYANGFLSADGGIRNQVGPFLQIDGGSAGVTYFPGSLGMGTSVPAEQLHVTGNIRADGAVSWGTAQTRTETKDNADAQGSKSGFYETSTPANYYPNASSWQHMIDVRHSNPGNNYAMQIAGGFFDDDLWYRKTKGSGTATWQQIIGHGPRTCTAPFNSIGATVVSSLGGITRSNTICGTTFFAAATFNDAQNTCAALGGHLPTYNDIYRLAQTNGLPNSNVMVNGDWIGQRAGDDDAYCVNASGNITSFEGTCNKNDSREYRCVSSAGHNG